MCILFAYYLHIIYLGGTALTHMSYTESLEIQDNRLLPLLVGACHAHISQLEKYFNIIIHSRGGTLTLCGTDTQVKKAINALQFLHDKAKSSGNLDAADIDTAIRFASMQRDLLGDVRSTHITTPKKTIKSRSPRQASYIHAMPVHTLCFGVGPAGTGKTYLAVAQAVSMLSGGAIDKIIITRPVVEAGENLGFLPGDLKEKVDPYLRPIYDALYDCMPANVVHRKMETNDIEIAPLAYMRGRTLKNACVILDEAQNTTPVQMQMFLTRLGQGSKMIVTGDMSQIDLPDNTVSGLVQATQILSHIDDISITHFTAADVVRHHLVGEIVSAYERDKA